MMRRAERPRAREPGMPLDADGAVDPRDLQRLVERQRRQQRRQPPREHRLAAAGRALHQQVVTAGRRDLQRLQRQRVAAHVSSGPATSSGGSGRAARRSSGSSGTVPPSSTAATSRRLATAATSIPSTSAASAARSRGTISPSQATATRALGGGEDAAAGTQLAAERQLAEDRPPLQSLGRTLTAGGEQADREPGVEARADLGQAGRREIGRDAPGGELEPAVEDRRAHAIARLADGLADHPDDAEGRQAGPDVDLDPHGPGVDSVDGECGDSTEHDRHATEAKCDSGHALCNNSAQSERFYSYRLQIVAIRC